MKVLLIALAFSIAPLRLGRIFHVCQLASSQ